MSDVQCRGTEEPPPLFFMSKKIYYQIFRNTRVNGFFFSAKNAFILPSGIHISEVSKPPPDKGGILTRLTSPSLTCTHSSRPQRDTSGVLVENPPAGGVSSLQSVPPPSRPPPHTRSFLACCLAFSLCSPPPPHPPISSRPVAVGY